MCNAAGHNIESSEINRNETIGELDGQVPHSPQPAAKTEAIPVMPQPVKALNRSNALELQWPKNNKGQQNGKNFMACVKLLGLLALFFMFSLF